MKEGEGSSDVRPGRRRFFQHLKMAAAAALAARVAPLAATPAVDTTRVQGAAVRPYGERSAFETSARWIAPARYPTSTASWTPLGDLHGVVTPSSLHYERHHAGVPTIDSSEHRLLVHGLVERPLVFSMAELMRFPAESRLCFLECSGNSASEWPGAGGEDVQQTHGLTSCSEWTGVPLRVVLAEAGLAQGAAWIVAEGADGAALTRSVPLAKAQDDILLAYAQNGEGLRPEQGYPLRLLVPGWEGSISVKWLRRLKVVAEPYYTREESAKYTDLMPDGRAREFTFVMEAKSVITSPSGRQRLAAPGFHEIRGLAWSGRGRITQVEISTDDGRSWQPAQLDEPVLPYCHTRFRHPWQWDGQATVLQSRCRDDSGYVQPTRAALRAVRGDHSFYHYNGIQRWQVAADGQVSNV